MHKSMSYIVFCLILLSIVSLTTVIPISSNNADCDKEFKSPSDLKIQRGINIGNALEAPREGVGSLHYG